MAPKCAKPICNMMIILHLKVETESNHQTNTKMISLPPIKHKSQGTGDQSIKNAIFKMAAWRHIGFGGEN